MTKPDTDPKVDMEYPNLPHHISYPQMIEGDAMNHKQMIEGDAMNHKPGTNM